MSRSSLLRLLLSSLSIASSAITASVGHAQTPTASPTNWARAGRGFLSNGYAGELFGPGKLLDSATYFIVLSDGISHGGSAKPSDGLHARFPKYTYDDMVVAQHRLLTEHLDVNHLRLIMGTSMGCMQGWVWGSMYPEFMDGLAPFACVPSQIAGRNRMIRTMAMDAIRHDPAWKGGEYTSAPPGLRAAQMMLYIMSSAPLLQHAQAPTRDKADSVIRAYHAPALFINSADDAVNPPELGMAERYAAMMPRTTFILLPITPDTRGHGTHSAPKVWGVHLSAFLAALPQQ